jgi:hypothetical protein
MAKSKPSETKEERRARKAEKKASKDTGVTKPRSEKKDKKDKKKWEVLAEKALNEITNGEKSSKKKGKKEEKQESEELDGGDGDGDVEVEAGEVEMSNPDEAETRKENVRSSKGKMSLKDRPVGALVPFAHPLADEKVAKKVFRGVKKGYSTPNLSVPYPCANELYSGIPTHPQARRQRSRQSTAQIPHLRPRELTIRIKFLLRSTSRHRHPRRRHLPHGRDLAHPRALRRPQYPIYLRHIASGAGDGGDDEEAYERGDDK